jgi:bifunctional UDP-N-acetylglucosamine pyrophosphorylase/glucosamine-1-phosphate N-acetyltransferase
MSTKLDDPTNYGRIVRDNKGKLLEILEEKDAGDEQKKIKEINAGIYCAEVDFLFDALKKVGRDNKQGEVYLTDIVKIAIDAGLQVDIFAGAGGEELLGINSRDELTAANKYLQHLKNSNLIAGGVNLVDPETIFIQQEVNIGRDTVIHANVQVSGNSNIGSNCTIGQNVVLHDCKIGDNAVIGPFSNLSSSIVQRNKTIAPHTNSIQD